VAPLFLRRRSAWRLLDLGWRRPPGLARLVTGIGLQLGWRCRSRSLIVGDSVVACNQHQKGGDEKPAHSFKVTYKYVKMRSAHA
jgi:hypothetical protein